MRSYGSRAAKLAFLTTPIFYVNASPHIGHLYSMVLADVAHRYARFTQTPSLLSTGTDEHGTKVARAAEKAGQPPQQFVNDLSNQFKRLATHANVDYTRFIRTSDPDHISTATDIWKRLQENGFIYLSKHSGWYCVSDETFYTDSELVETPDGQKLSAESGNPVEWYEEENWFFRLSKLQPALIKLFEDQPDFVLPHARHQSILNELRSSQLTDLSISRPIDRCSWGIDVPAVSENGGKHTMYVWFEALINYLTVAREFGAGKWWPPTHIIGKDIIRFHAVYWPAFLLAAGLAPPKQVVVHSHWTLEGTKMSKSKQNVVDPFEIIDKYGLDSVRYVLCHDASLAHDSPFSYGMLVERHNVNLVNKWGNLASRVCGTKFDIPKSLQTLADITKRQPEEATDLCKDRDICAEYASRFEFGRYARHLNELALDANIKFQTAEPWVDPASEKSRLAVGKAAEQCRIIALLLSPICPTYASQMLDRLGVHKDRRTFEYAEFGTDLEYGQGANRNGDHVLQRIK